MATERPLLPRASENPSSIPCPYCKNGTTVGPNGERWRCFACKGGGRLLATEPESKEGSA